MPARRLFPALAIFACLSLSAPAAEPHVFKVENPDRELSPQTGMTREHWLECGKFILAGAFQHVDNIDDPMLFPKVPGKSYPRKGYEKASQAN